MGILMVTYNGHIVAFCTVRRADLVDDFDSEIDGERIGPFLLGMCLYARDVLNGVLPPPYEEDSARTFARAFLGTQELQRTPTAEHQSAHRFRTRASDHHDPHEDLGHPHEAIVLARGAGDKASIA